jgi:CO/xanthine dehydrogenase FAD-binding subunit
MDLRTVTALRRPRTREDAGLGEGDTFLGGGSWLFSEPQLHLRGLVDLTALDWAPVVVTPHGVSIAATCSIADLVRAASEPSSALARAGWPAVHLVERCASALLGSFKVWNVATVGGNICLALPAGPMTSLATALDADAVIWTPGGGERRMPVIELVTGVQRTALGHGELLRSVEVPVSTLRSRTGFRRIALSPLGRTGTLVIARLDESGEGGDRAFVVTVSGGTRRPEQVRFAGLPTRAELEESIRRIDSWYDDLHGSPDWREAMSVLYAEELRVELGGGTAPESVPDPGGTAA